jgi:hypothetical protein
VSDRLAPDLVDKGMLTEWDVDAFAVFCDAVATYHGMPKDVGGVPVSVWQILGAGFGRRADQIPVLADYA